MTQTRSCTVFVGNVPYDAQEDELRNIFSRVGSVESFRLVYDKDTKQPKGYGFCDYSDADTALSAIRNLNDVECNGRRLRIDLADNALRNREIGGQKVIPPLPLPAPEPPPRPALPPVTSGPPAGPPPPAALPSPVTAAPPRPQLPPPGAQWPATTPPPAFAGEGVTAASTSETAFSDVSAHNEIAQTIAMMPRAQLQLCLGSMQQLVAEAPESARALLQEKPQLCYALLYAQFVLGLNLVPSFPPSSEEIQSLKSEGAGGPVASAGSNLVNGPPRSAVPGALFSLPRPVHQTGLPPTALGSTISGTQSNLPGAETGLAPKGSMPRPSSTLLPPRATLPS